MKGVLNVDAYVGSGVQHGERVPKHSFVNELGRTDLAMADDHVVNSKTPGTSLGGGGRPTGLQDYVTDGPTSDCPDTAFSSGMKSADSALWTAEQEQLNVLVQAKGITPNLLGSRVFGVHLLANTYLSELTISRSDVTEVTWDSALPRAESITPEIPTQLSRALRTAEDKPAAEVALGDEVVVALNLFVDGETKVSEWKSSYAPSISAAGVSEALWTESSLRLTRQRDGSTTIWLRDYRISHEDASRLVDILVKNTGARGMSLGRIFLNGHEVWADGMNY